MGWLNEENDVTIAPGYDTAIDSGECVYTHNKFYDSNVNCFVQN